MGTCILLGKNLIETHPYLSLTLISCLSYKYLQQAQIYFIGSSRYLGVYDCKRAAAVAFGVASDYLDEARKSLSVATCPPLEADKIFSKARRLALKAGEEIDLANGGTTAMANHFAMRSAAKENQAPPTNQDQAYLSESVTENDMSETLAMEHDLTYDSDSDMEHVGMEAV